MHRNQIVNQMLDFNRTFYDRTCKNISILQELMETQGTLCIDRIPCNPELKKAVKNVLAMYQKGFEDYRTLMDGNMRKMDMLFRRKTSA
ncbi:MAG TPA: hypothetical protein VMB77_02080 [Syntrophales bacterium]|nr:hypothetical protein [Syntrophales bacterium]